MNNSINVDIEFLAGIGRRIAWLEWQFQSVKISKDQVVQPLYVNHRNPPLQRFLVLLTARS